MAINSRVNYNPPLNNSNYNKVLWADLPLNLDISPITGDLLRVVNVACVQQSMEMIINTYMYERPYLDIGTSTQLRLFQNSTSLEVQLIKDAVFLSLKQYEPRAIIQDVEVDVNPAGNYYTLTITWNLINSTVVQTFTTILKRNR